MSLAERLDNADKFVRKISAPRFQEIESKVESFTNSQVLANQRLVF